LNSHRYFLTKLQIIESVNSPFPFFAPPSTTTITTQWVKRTNNLIGTGALLAASLPLLAAFASSEKIRCEPAESFHLYIQRRNTPGN
jgi:hypothetical protein